MKMTACIGKMGKQIRKQSGQSLVEYSLVLGLVVVVCIAALTVLGTNTSTKVNNVATQLSH